MQNSPDPVMMSNPGAVPDCAFRRMEIHFDEADFVAS